MSFKLNKLLAIVLPRAFTLLRNVKHHTSFFKTVLRTSKLLTTATLCQIAFLQPKNKKDMDMKAVLNKADQLYKERKFEELSLVLQQQSDPKSTDVLWRLGRANYELAMQISDKKIQFEQLQKAFALLEDAVKLDGDNGYAHKWYAILSNSLLSYKGVKEKITEGKVIKQHLETAIQLIPTDATTHHILGLWFYSVAELTWYERKIAAIIYTTPPASTYEEALVCFEKAENVDPLFYNMNLLMLAKCYLKTDQSEKAKDSLIKTINYPIEKPGDEKIRDEAQSLLKKLT